MTRHHTGSRIVSRPLNLSGKEWRRLQRHAEGRTCPVCGVRLNSWNPGPNCYLHDDTPYPANIVIPDDTKRA